MVQCPRQDCQESVSRGLLLSAWSPASLEGHLSPFHETHLWRQVSKASRELLLRYASAQDRVVVAAPLVPGDASADASAALRRLRGVLRGGSRQLHALYLQLRLQWMAHARYHECTQRSA